MKLFKSIIVVVSFFVFPFFVSATTALVNGQQVASSTTAGYAVTSSCFNGSSCSYSVFDPQGNLYTFSDSSTNPANQTAGYYGAWTVVVGPNNGNFDTNCQSSDTLNSCTTYMMTEAQANGAVAVFEYVETITPPEPASASSTVTFIENTSQTIFYGIVIFFLTLAFIVFYFKTRV